MPALPGLKTNTGLIYRDGAATVPITSTIAEFTIFDASLFVMTKTVN